VSMTLKGGKELPKKLEKLAQQYASKLGVAVGAAALIVSNDAKSNAPYLTGNLRRSIHIEPDDSSGERVVVKVGTDVEYARYQEFGTSTIPPHPYLRPALDQNKDKVKAEIKRVMRILG